MTFRAKPVVKREQRSPWHSQDRRNFFLNLGFGVVVVAAVVILAVAVGFTYYNDHFASVGSVGGTSISKDELRDRARIEQWRLSEAGARIRTEVAAGHLTQAQADLQNQIIAQQEQQLVPLALERLIDTKIQSGLATTEGIAVTEADIDAQMVVEATTPEKRHAWVIEVAPEVTGEAVEPTEAQKTAAKAKADQALRDLQGGKPWEEIAKVVSTDASTAPQAGDLGWLQADDSQADEGYLSAIFAAEANVPTAVVEGADGVYRIGRVTEIAAESVDPAYDDKIVNEGGLELAKYREAVRGDVIRDRLEDKVVAEAIKPGPQRDVQELYISEATATLPADAVKVRHILYSPKDDPAAAQGGEIPADDPSWAQAKADADAAWAKIQADADLFDSIARAESDEEPARGPDGSGGVLPSYVSADSTYVESFSKPILDADPSDGQLIGPIKTEFGYHIVQVLNHRPDPNEIKAKADGGADFGQLAKDLSEGAEAEQGGSLGWVAKGQLDERLIAAIFDTEIGKTSQVLPIPEDGIYLYKVLAEETRTPEGRQLEEITASAFNEWYALKKASVQITRDETITNAVG